MSKRPLQNVDAYKNAKKPRGDEVNTGKPQQIIIQNQNNTNQKAKAIIIDDSDDDFDAELCLVSQQVEESVKVNPDTQKFAFDCGYSEFLCNPSCSSSTQMNQNINVNLGSQSSQKENNQQHVKIVKISTIDKNFVKPPLPRPQNEPQNQNSSYRPTENQTESEKQQLVGEVSTLRCLNKQLLNELSALKSKYHDEKSTTERQKHEQQEKLKKEIKKLEVQLQFHEMNNRMHGTRRESIDTENKTFPIDIPSMKFHAQLNVPEDFFQNEPDVNDQNSTKPKINIIPIQMWIAKIQAEVLRTGVISDSIVKEMFNGVSNIVKVIEMEFNEFNTSYYMTLNKKDTYAKYALGMSVPVLRPIPIDENFSITKSSKLFTDELCDVPRRILAMIAILCRNSKALTKLLLTENIRYEEDSTKQKPFAAIITDILATKVVKSDRFYNLEGFVMSAVHLLSSMCIHADSSNNLQLFELFKNILYCKQDNPFVVLNCSEFMYEFINQSKDATVFKPLLCQIGKYKAPSSNPKLRLLYFPDNSCPFRLLMMYMLTSFTQARPLNKVEMKYVQRTSFYLNSMTIKMLGMDATAFIDETTKEKICGCYHNLINAIILLAHMSTDKGCQSKDLVLFNGVTFTTITVLNQIFTRLDELTDFPVQNLFYANYLEAFCLRVEHSNMIEWVKHFKIERQFKIISEPHVQIAAGVAGSHTNRNEDRVECEDHKAITEGLRQILNIVDDEYI